MLQQTESELYQKFRKSSYLAEMYLQQRSKVNWIRLGDDNDNSEYFYSFIKHRRRQHAIAQLKDNKEEYKQIQKE